jgi:hypothetical protein
MFEDKIKTFKHLFEEEPEAGHEERFKNKLPMPGVEKSTGVYMKVAGLLVIVGLSIVFTTIIYNNLLSNENILANFDSKPEFIEAESYFRMKINEKLHEIEKIPVHESEKTKLLMEFRSLDESYYILMNDFKANPHDDRIINALNQHYQYKLEALDRVLNKINKKGIAPTDVKI